MFCTKCGEQTQAEAVFCGFCGQRRLAADSDLTTLGGAAEADQPSEALWAAAEDAPSSGAAPEQGPAHTSAESDAQKLTCGFPVGLTTCPFAPITVHELARHFIAEYAINKTVAWRQAAAIFQVYTSKARITHITGTPEPPSSGHRKAILIGLSIGFVIILGVIFGTNSRQKPDDKTSAASPMATVVPDDAQTRYDLQLLHIGNHLHELGDVALAQADNSDDLAVKSQQFIEGAADDLVGCEVWSSMKTITMTTTMQSSCKEQENLAAQTSKEMQAAIEQQRIIVRTELSRGRYPR